MPQPRCEWCDKQMDSSNMKRHLNSCFYKNEVQIKKYELQLLKGKRPRDESDIKQEVTFVELKHFLTESYTKAMMLYKKILDGNSKDPVQKIKEMNVSPPTLDNYLLKWRLYTKWLRRNNRTVSAESANSYISSLNCRASTQRKKHNTLQLLLQHLIDRNVRLNKFRMRISFTPKKALSDKELAAYLQEQREIDTEDYLIQRLLATYGLRINTAALLKIKDLEFLNVDGDEDHLIHLPDSKVKNRRLEKITPELEALLKKFIKGDTKPENYVFYMEGRNKARKIRAQDLCMRINKRIKESKVLKKSDNYKYTSHMFRKTKAYNMYQKGNELLKEQIRSSIGQSQGSTAVEFYIN
jgi:integrase